jgi:integrase
MLANITTPKRLKIVKTEEKLDLSDKIKQHLQIQFEEEEGGTIVTEFTAEQIIRAEELKENSKSTNTKRAYESDWSLFIAFTQELIPPPEEHQLNEKHVLAFMMRMQQYNYKFSTIERRISAIRHRINSQLQMENIKAHMEGMRREMGRVTKHKEPIMLEQLHQMIDSMGTEQLPLLIQDRAIMTILWHSAMRREEFCQMVWDDISFNSDGLIINIPSSKTDQQGQGQKVGIISRRDKYCPVRFLQHWRQISYEGKMSPQENKEVEPSVWKTIKGKKVIVVDSWFSVDSLYARCKKYIEKIDLDPKKYSPHSYRAGLATQAGVDGVPIPIIQSQTRHKSASGLDPYLQVTNKMKYNVGRHLSQQR